jgi:hypothetical protein
MKFLILAFLVFSLGCNLDPIDLTPPWSGDQDSEENHISWPGGESDWERIDSSSEETQDEDTGSFEDLVFDTSYPVGVDTGSESESEFVDTATCDTALPLDSDSSTASYEDSASIDTESAEDSMPGDTESGEDTGTSSTDVIDTETEETVDTDTGQLDTDDDTGQEFLPWEPDIDDSSYWKKFYPDDVVIYRNDTDQYMPGSYIDEDGDGFTWYEDCDDRNPQILPGRYESQMNGVDDNCNCKIDEDPEDFEPEEGCPEDWWEKNFKNTLHIEWTIPGAVASSADEAFTVCDELGYGWRVPYFYTAAKAFINPKIGIDPETGEPSNAYGSCWCSFPWGGDSCGPPIWVIGYDQLDAEDAGVMRCDAYIEDILDTDGGYLSPNRQIYPESLISGHLPVICMRKMPNGIE